MPYGRVYRYCRVSYLRLLPRDAFFLPPARFSARVFLFAPRVFYSPPLACRATFFICATRFPPAFSFLRLVFFIHRAYLPRRVFSCAARQSTAFMESAILMRLSLGSSMRSTSPLNRNVSAMVVR